MEQTEIILHILYFLVTVIVTCESRFRHLGQSYYTGGGYTGGPTASVYQRENTYNERYPKSWPYNVAPFNEGNLPSSYSNQLPVNTGYPVSNRGLQAETSPYSSNQTPPGRYINTYTPGYTPVNNDEGSILYDKSLFVRPGVGYQNTNVPEKVRIDPRYPLYDGSQAVHPYENQNRINVYNRSPFHKFKSPSSGQTKIHPTPYSGTSRWNIIPKNAANKVESLAYDGYLGVRSFRNNPTGQEREDLTVRDNLPLYDSDGDPTDYLVVKKKLMADYYFV